MSLDLLKENIEREKNIARELSTLVNNLKNEQDSERAKLIITAINPLLSQIKILNRAVPELINNVSFYKTLSPEKKEKENENLTNIKFLDDNKKEISLTVKKHDEQNFFKHLFYHDSAKEKIKLQNSGRNSDIEFYARVSNRFFRNYADKLVKEGRFSSIKTDLRKITSPIVINSFIAMMLFTVSLSVIFSLILALILVAFNLYLIGAVVFILIPLLTYVFFYFYPSSEKKSLEKEINQELPFLTIFMAAISTSGIEPSKIFQILVGSKDYPFSTREIKKLNNYLNFYGYDLVGALKKTAESCPSEKLGLLFNGLATTITSGGELSNFLSKHAETLLFDYRLEREKYTHVAETFMNIYISVVIAAPMILMMLFVLISVAKLSEGLMDTTTFTVLIVFAISMINILFLLFLNIKQPKF